MSNYVLNSGSAVINIYKSLTVNVLAGSNTITVDNVTDLSIGDLILIHQTQSPLVSDAGNYEYGRILTAIGTTITLESNLTNSYTTGSYNQYNADVTQVVLIPEYDSIEIQSAATLTCDAWNGTVGGILAIGTQGTCLIEGEVIGTALGFRGGFKDIGGGGDSYACRGEGIHGSDPYTGYPHQWSRTQRGGGGGGGVEMGLYASHNRNGGSGGHVTAGSDGSTTSAGGIGGAAIASTFI